MLYLDMTILRGCFDHGGVAVSSSGVDIYTADENDSFSNIKMILSAYSHCSWIKPRVSGVTLGQAD